MAVALIQGGLEVTIAGTIGQHHRGTESLHVGVIASLRVSDTASLPHRGLAVRCSI
jgi:hypothetical protein